MMQLKSREVEIVEDDPFHNDVLNRKDSAEALTEFVLSADDSVVICIDAPWGQGKTTFLRMWEQELKNKNVPTIYFNAWENDFSDDALVCLIGEVAASIAQISKSGDESKAREYLAQAKDVGVTLLKRSIPVAAKIATAGALDLDKITEQALAGFAETLAKEELEKYEKAKGSLKAFRKALAGLTNSITDAENPRPLIFIIDELDRCRPNFSVEILEKAKHFFSVPNIVFVLGADKKQLGSSIKALYGEGLNVNGYLRRFMDFDYILPSPDKGLFVKALFRKHSFDEYFKKKAESGLRFEGEQALSMFSELFELYKLTLREQEHCCSILSISIRTTPHDYKLFPIFLCFLIVLKVKDVDLYGGLVNEELSPAELLSRFKAMPGAKEILVTDYGTALEAYIVICKSYRHSHDDIDNQYQEISESETAREEDKHRANSILKIINDFDRNGGVGALGYLLKKIEVASRFEA
ncbi:KAP family P-loop NTPase fold protein [Methylotuvimicrobium sp.]|uniref:KAP family P-loop NTPase fold protein n=1 Tax=Methylotuvimicrobium sp. TaxID=2822413 RepID=UPI003D659168